MSGLLNHSPAEIVQSLIIEELGLGAAPEIPTADNWPVYASHHPDTPDDSICLFDTEGRLQGRTQVDGEMHIHHGLQIRVRSLDYSGYAKAQQLAHALDTEVLRLAVVVDSHSYLVHCLTRTTDVLPLGFEQGSRRRLWTVNFLVAISTLPGTGT